MEDLTDILNGFGARLTQAIAAAKTTPSQVARAMNISPQAVYNYEAREGGISVAKLFRLSDLLRVDASWLATGRTSTPNSNPVPNSAPGTLTERLRHAAKEAGFESQSSLARASGVPQATISRILSGDGSSGPELETIRKLASACRVSLTWLAEGMDAAPVPPILSMAQTDWLGLMEDLGSDDLNEFSQAIADRQARNRRLLADLGKKGR